MEEVILGKLKKELYFKEIMDKPGMYYCFQWKSNFEGKVVESLIKTQGLNGEEILTKPWPIYRNSKEIIYKMKLYVDGKYQGDVGWAIGDYWFEHSNLIKFFPKENYQEPLESIYDFLKNRIMDRQIGEVMGWL